MHTRTAPGHPIRIGRRQLPPALTCRAHAASSLADDLKLFATTFAAGFVFVSLYLL